VADQHPTENGQENKQQDDDKNNGKSVENILLPAFGRAGTVLFAVYALIHKRHL
jgi:hypothetical protein